ncbi:MAG TPA: hypothetical protein VI337_04105 [Nitrospirales bacterium]|jgi:hypothetical protein|nr:hypothetical protein [Nitrospirales bacterium]
MAERTSGQPTRMGTGEGTPSTIQLIHVLIVREGELVSSKWGIHPQLKRDLSPSEWKELNDHMNRVTDIVGAKFAEQLSSNEGNTPAEGTA